MGCSNRAGNIAIEPVKVIFGKYECSTVVATADVASSHNNDYFVLYSALDAVKYHVWLNVGGAGVDPAPAASTGIPVAVAVNASASTVASAIAAAIDAVSGGPFEAEATGSSVCICNMQPGNSTDVAAGVGLAGFTYTVNVQGTYDDLGFCDGDVEVAFEESLLDITTHQTGTDILTSIRQGKSAEVTMTLQETDIANIKLIMSQAGAVFTPSGGSNEVVGWGTSTNSENIIDKAGKLILHPYNLSDSDRSRDWAFWLAHMKPESVTFSGENPELVSLSFKCYTDESRDTRANLLVKGDHTQNYKA
jgi:hypothetical protein